ncbi:unnamed protein product [Clonostachys rosea]|uniref:F-box domain-containing protein n=1 Tax=Bionectria ochroleuca TaxID=29856 RepID=A0ABY6UAQ8_BIOOC|nr:unnamed protein product [Clonostachys rosea]
MANRLPVEIWWNIGDEIDNVSDLASVARTSKQLHRLVNPQLYKLAARSFYGLKAIFWGVSRSMPGTVNYSVAAGIDPNIIWHARVDARERTRFELIPTLDECLFSAKAQITLQDETWDCRPSYWSPIHIAAAFDNLPMAKLLLEHGARPDIGSFGACHCYHTHDYARRVRSSFIYFPWVRFPSWTPYHVAICRGSLRVGEYFMKENEDTEMECFEWYPKRPRTGMTPFHVAGLHGDEDLLRVLIERKGTRDIEATDARGATPLVYACFRGKWECASILLQHGANINRVCTRVIERHGRHSEILSTTILADTLESSRFEDCLRLLELGADPQISDRTRQGRLPLIHQLCMDSWGRGWEWNGTTTRQVRTEAQAISGLKLLDHFINTGLDFRKSAREHLDFGPIYNTALCFAAASANLAAVKRLVEAGADINGNVRQDIMTPLTRACNVYNGPEAVEMVTLLIEWGASVNRVRDNTQAPLWTLWEDVHIDTAQQEVRRKLTDLLLEHGSNPGRGTDGSEIIFTTALDGRLLEKDFAAFEDLRARSAPGSIAADDFLGFWDAAVRTGDPEVVRYVIEDDMDGVIAQRCSTALAHLLINLPHETDLITTLLDRGANPNGPCAGDTPLSYVISRTAWPIPRKELLLKTLLNAKASIHRRPQRTPVQGQDGQNEHDTNNQLDEHDEENGQNAENAATLYRGVTPLDLAIQGLDKSARFLEIMLEMQPLRDDPEIHPFRYIHEACKLGNFRALSAIVKSSEDAHRTMRENATSLVHHLLDSLIESTTMRHVNASIDCLRLLLENGADLSAPLPDEASDGRLAKQKLLGYMSLDNSPQCSDKDRALSWCLRQKIHFTDNDYTPVFMPETTALFFQLHTTLENLGKILGSDSRRYHIVTTRS